MDAQAAEALAHLQGVAGRAEIEARVKHLAALQQVRLPVRVGRFTFEVVPLARTAVCDDRKSDDEAS